MLKKKHTKKTEKLKQKIKKLKNKKNYKHREQPIVDNYVDNLRIKFLTFFVIKTNVII